MLKTAFQGKTIDEMYCVYSNNWLTFLEELSKTATIQISKEAHCYKDELTYGGRIAKFYAKVTKNFPVK